MTDTSSPTPSLDPLAFDPFRDDTAEAYVPPLPPLDQPPPTRKQLWASRQWTPKKMMAFLSMLSATHSVSAAAKSVNMSRQSAYRLRAKLKGQPFDIAWETAFRHGYDELAQAALERALHGVEMPVYYQGEKVGSYRKYDERLTIALLSMRSKTEMPLLGRYRVAAEWNSENWEDLLERIERGGEEWNWGPDASPMSDDARIECGITATWRN
ncbi:hypothetical protein [Alterisphingorhabdus coralli]|uniref:LysR family transcriptional regulator n=1 Tax=Alterisphingorhabdus coralli TaxID=3071408 RepID=A0AA97F7H8_9SPHN|nr:hypothetical protein [Parasphingorhabdus sp. SCSIO 66989]WOE74901.1 hypothetical protein RB602_13840 [Parasphingorhabdus sp. SCSIO 66989]